MTDPDKARREIRKIAYRLWQEEGCPDGRDRAHWEAAKEIWAFRAGEETQEPGGQALAAEADADKAASLGRKRSRRG